MVGGHLYAWLDGRRFDVLAGVAGIALAVAMLPLPLIASHIYVVGIPLVAGIASVVYLLAVRSDRETAVAPIPTWWAQLLPSVVFFLLAALVVLGLRQGGRTVAFYNVASVVGVLLFYQVFFVRDADVRPRLLVAQILAFAFVVRFVALYTTPGYVGIDIWSHVANYATAIRETASLAPLAEQRTHYYAAPLFHLVIVVTSLVADVPIRTALYLSVGVGVPLSGLFVLSAARLFVDARWSVFAFALFAVIGYTIEWSIHLIPTSLGLLFFAAIFYLLCRLLYLGVDDREYLLVVLLSAFVILTHQVSSFILLLFTASGLLAHLLLSHPLFSTGELSRDAPSTGRASAYLTGLLVFDLGFITFMWSWTPYRGSTFLETVFSFFYVAAVESGGFGALASEEEREAAAAPVEPSLIEQIAGYVDAAAFLLLFFLTVVGCLYVLRRRNITHATLTAGVSIVVMFVFVFGFPMFGIRTFIPTRWFAFLTVPMALLAALGTAYVARNLDPPVAFALLLVFALVFPAVSLASSSATVDDHRFEGVEPRYSYTEAELAAVQTLGDRLDVEEADDGLGPLLYTDHPYQTVFQRTGSHRAEPVQLDDEQLGEYQAIVYRDYQSAGEAYFRDENEVAHQPSVAYEDVCGGDRHHVYDNGEVRACLET